MAVPVQTPYQEYTANGVTTSFAVTFQCLSKDTLIVTINGVEQSPTLWNFTGGNVVFVAAPANLAIVGIKRSTALTREVTYQTYDNSLRPDVLNSDIDRLWHVLQENKYIYDAKVDKATQIQTEGNLQGGGQINGGLTLSLKDQDVMANYQFGSSIKIPVITLNQDGTVKAISEADLGGTGGTGGTGGGEFYIPWTNVSAKPTTIAGYGITDAYTKTEANAQFIEATEKGVANGVATLDTNTLIPITQLPQATTTNIGAVEIATQTEVNNATDAARVVVPSTLKGGIQTHLNASGSAPMYACRAWVNFNGSGTVAIRASGNVSSITDNGVGDYTVNFIIAMPDTNYAIAGAATLAAGSGSGSACILSLKNSASGVLANKSTTAAQIVTVDNNTDGLYDSNDASVSFYG